MWELLRKAIVRPLVRRWLRASRHSWEKLPTPEREQVVVAPGPDPDRVLLAGSGIAVGYGMRTHDLALGGHLARELASITGRGAEVDVLAQEHMTAESLRTELDARRLLSVDAIVSTPGSVESLLMMSSAAWRAETTGLLDHVHRTAPASVHIFLVAVPPLPDLVPMPWLLARLASLSARRLNRQLREVCASRAFATFVPFEPTEPAGRTGTGRTYQRWAELIAPLVSTALERQAKADR